jgi:hypothetical protein
MPTVMSEDQTATVPCIVSGDLHREEDVLMNTTTALTKSQCLQRIGNLPHAGVILTSDAERWVAQTMLIDPERIEWHIKRAGGIGGSEAGAMLAFEYGGIAVREHADRLARRKLFMLPPDRANHDTGRGHYLEPHIRAVYEEKLTRSGMVWSRRDDLKSIIESGPHPEMPWLRASLDGLYEIDGQIVLPDFKAPSEAVLNDYMKHHDYDDYKAQLNHYAMVADGHGIRIDRLELALYDYRRVSTEGVRICPVALDPNLQEKLARASGIFWNDFVMQGCLPESDREIVLTHKDIPEDIERAAKRAVDAKILGDHFMDDYEEQRVSVARWVANKGRLGQGTVFPIGSFAEGQRGLLEIRSKLVLDVEKALDRLRDLGVSDEEIEELRLPDSFNEKKMSAGYDTALRAIRLALRNLETGSLGVDAVADLKAALEAAPIVEKGCFDKRKIQEKLVALGEVVDNFLIEQVAGTLPRGKSQDLLQKKELLAAAGDEFIDSLVACIEVTEELSEDFLRAHSPEGLSSRG